jgi:hypothetical protein
MAARTQRALVRAAAALATLSSVSLLQPVTASPTDAPPISRVRRPEPPAPRFVFGTGTPARSHVDRLAGLRASREATTLTGGSAAEPAGTDEPRRLAPVQSLSFEAIPRTGGNWPADPIGAKGVSSIVTAVNAHTAVYALDGSTLLAPTSLSSFVAFPGGTQLYDPKVVFDQYTSNFVLSYLAVNDAQRRSRIVLATIPDSTAADISTWCFIKIPGDGVDGNGRQWSDYPGLGYDMNAVTVTANAFHFKTQRFAYAQILRFPKDTFYDPSCTQTALYRRFSGRATRNPDGSKAFTIQPAASVGPEATSQYLVSYERRQEVSAVVLWRMHDTPNGLRLERVALPVAKASISPYGTQRGGTLRNADTWWDPGDLRLINAYYDSATGNLYTAHVIAKDIKPDVNTGGYGEAAIRWYEIVPGSAPSEAEVQRIGIVGTPETDAGWPTIATDGAGNVFIAYNRASAVRGTREYLSAWAAEIPVGTKEAELLLLWSGEARMEAVPGPERWGDFNGINRDPVDPAVMAMVNQFAESDGGGATQDWQQTVHLVSHG